MVKLPDNPSPTDRQVALLMDLGLAVPLTKAEASRAIQDELDYRLNRRTREWYEDVEPTLTDDDRKLNREESDDDA